MPEILPKPSVGTIIELDPVPVFPSQPRRGTVIELDPNPPTPVRRGYRGIGLVRGSRG